MKKTIKFIATIVIIAIIVIALYSDTDLGNINRISDTDIFSQEYTSQNEYIEFTNSELVNEVVNQIEMQRGDIIKVKRLPYQLEFNIGSSHYIVTHVSEYNKELEYEFNRPTMQVELIPNSRNQSILESDTMTLLKILAPTISNSQAQKLIDGQEEEIIIPEYSETIIKVDIGEAGEGNKKLITVTREYGGFINDSENPLVESKQPVDTRFSINYKNGNYANYTPNLWINQIMSDMESVFNWNLDTDNLYNVYGDMFLGNIYVLPDELNDGYTKEIEVSASGHEDSFQSGLSIPSLSIRIDREWQSEEEKKSIIGNIIKVLNENLSDSEIEEMYDYIVDTEESSDDKFYSFENIDVENFQVSQNINGIRLKRIFMEEIEDLPLYNLAGFSDWIKVEETLLEELLTPSEAKDLNKYYNNMSTSYSTYTNNSDRSSSSIESTLNDSIRVGIVTAVQKSVEQTEGFSGIDWPWGDDDYNIKEIAPDMFTTHGQFAHGGNVYNFELIIMMRPDTSGRIEFYNVY